MRPWAAALAPALASCARAAVDIAELPPPPPNRYGGRRDQWHCSTPALALWYPRESTAARVRVLANHFHSCRQDWRHVGSTGSTKQWGDGKPGDEADAAVARREDVESRQADEHGGRSTQHGGRHRRRRDLKQEAQRRGEQEEPAPFVERRRFGGPSGRAIKGGERRLAAGGGDYGASAEYLRAEARCQHRDSESDGRAPAGGRHPCPPSCLHVPSSHDLPLACRSARRCRPWATT